MSHDTLVIEADPEVIVIQGEADTVIDTHVVTEVVERDGETIVETVVLNEVIDLTAAQEVIEVARQGPPGPQGPIGPAGGAAFERQSAGALSALRVVWEDESGAVRPLDYRDEDHIDLIAGLTLTGTPAAGAVTVQRGGPVDDAAWAWTSGRVWLGADGALTQTPPADGFDVLVGYAVSPTRLYLDMQDNIELEG